MSLRRMEKVFIISQCVNVTLRRTRIIVCVCVYT